MRREGTRKRVGLPDDSSAGASAKAEAPPGTKAGAGSSRRIACLVGDAASSQAATAREFSPWVEVADDGAACFDVRGCGALHGDEEGLAADVAVRAGAGARVGIAGSKAAARLAAEFALGVIPPGKDREVLARLPLEALHPSPEVAAAFRRWGITRCGRLAALPRGEVALRLGAEGARLWEIAGGEDDEPLVPAPLPDEPEEEVDLEFPLVQVEPLLFVLRGALDRLAARLAERGAVFGTVVLRLRLEGGEEEEEEEGEQKPRRNTEEHRYGEEQKRERKSGSGRVDERRLSLAAPMRDVPSILALLRVSIESSPPRSPVLGLAVRAVPAASRPGQLSLFEPAGPAPQKLAVALTRLAALVGPERVGTPVVPDAHRSAAPLPLRVLRPPLPAEVLSDGEEPQMNTDAHRWGISVPLPAQDRIRVHPCSSVVSLSRLRTADHRFSGDIRRASGPWKLRSGWWSDAPVERDYYDAELSSGALVRLYRDVLGDAWFVDGVYD